MSRACRSTRIQLAQAEAHQDAVIADLVESGHGAVAARLHRCQRERQHREIGRFPWRCRSPGCWACRRTLSRKWWQAFRAWLTDPEVSLVVIPLAGDPISATKKLRRSLRDVRDRAGRQDPRWRAVAMAGLVDGDQALILVQHPGIDRASLWAMLERRWPNVLLADPGSVDPASALAARDAAALARRRRGIEPIRIVILPQAMAATGQENWGEPMPMIV